MAAPALNTRLIVMPDVEFRPVDTGALLVDVRSGACFRLNHVGAELWQRIAAGLPLSEAIDAIASRYQASEDTIVADALALREQLTAAGLVHADDEEIARQGRVIP